MPSSNFLSFCAFVRLTLGVRRSDDKRAWDQGAYLILARLDLSDVSVQREADDLFMVRVDGVGDQRFQMRDRQHLTEFLEKLQAARAVRRASATPRSDSEQQSPAPSPLLFRRESVWPRGTLVGQAMEDDVSEEFDTRINNQAELVEMVRRAYASDGFLSNPRMLLAIKTDSAASSLAVDTLRQTLQGTPLESPDLNRAETLEEAKSALLRVVQLSDAQKMTLASYNSKRSTATAAESDKLAAKLLTLEAEKAAAEEAASRLKAELHKTRLSYDEQLSRLERDNALLDMKAADATDRAAAAEEGLMKTAARLEDTQSMLEKERSKEAVLKEMLAEQQQQQKKVVHRAVENVQAQMTKRSSKLVIEAKAAVSPFPDSNSSMADFSIAEEDLDSILGEFVASPEERGITSGNLSAGDITVRDFPVAAPNSGSNKALSDLVAAVNALTQDQSMGRTDETNAVKNVERVRSEVKRLREEADRSKLERQQSSSTAEKQLEQARKEKQSAETAFRMAEAVGQAAKQEAGTLRAEKKTLEQQLESAKKEAQVLREASHRVGDVAAAANKTESQLKTELREAQRENRRLQAELEETQGALKTAQTIAADATDRARQERQRGSILTTRRVDEESQSLNAVQAKSATEELRKLVQRQETLRRQLTNTLTVQDMLRMMGEQDRELDAALRLVETPLGITAAAAAFKSPRSVAPEATADVKLQQLRVEAARLESSLQTMSSELSEARDKVKSEHVARAEAERLVAIEKSRVSFLEKRVEELTHECRVAKDEATNAAARVAADKKTLTMQHHELEASRNKVTNLEMAAAESAAALSAATARAAELEKKLRESEEANKSKLASLEKEFGDADRAAKEKAAEDKKVDSIREGAIRDATLRKQLEAKESEAADLKGDIEDLHGELTAIKAQLSAALGACTKLRQEKGELMTKVEKLSSTVKDLLKHSNEQTSELKLEKSRNASLRGSPRMSPRRDSPTNSSVDMSFDSQMTDVMSQLRAANEKLEASERKSSNLLETNKALLSRLNELQKKK